jgi:two-component system invasion response regulator UvrY
MIKVLLVDDHQLIRSCFTDVLGKDPELAIVAEAGNGEEAIRLVRSHRPDVVLMDVSMPGIGGLEATRRISQSFPDTRIIALTMCGDDPFPSRLLEAGATGYITKGSNIEEVIDAIKSVNGGTEYITQEIAQKLAITYINKKVKSPLDTLTPREMQVLLMVAQGFSNAEISRRLCLSPKTTCTHRYHLYEKLGVSNDVELTRFAIRHGLLEEDIPVSA